MVWGKRTDGGQWEVEDEDKMEEENKKRLDGRWWRKRMEGRWRRGMRRQQEMDKEDRRDTYRGIEEDRLEGNEGGWMRRWEMDKEGIGNVEVEKVNLGDIGS